MCTHTLDVFQDRTETRKYLGPISLTHLLSATCSPVSPQTSLKYTPGLYWENITGDLRDLSFANVFTHPETAILRSWDNQSVLHSRRKRTAQSRDGGLGAHWLLVNSWTAKNLGSCIFLSGKWSKGQNRRCSVLKSHNLILNNEWKVSAGIQSN